MKKIILLLIGFCFACILNAQVSKTLHVSAGSLSTLLTADEKATVTNLTLTGNLDARDFKTMRDDMPLLAKLDLSGVSITTYTGTEGTAGTGSLEYPANTVPDYAFCTAGGTWLGKTSLTSVVLPSSVTSIGNYVFDNCSGLKSVNIPSLVSSIGISAFYNCINLPSISIPSSVITIGNKAFFSCKSLGSLTIPASVTTIGLQAFYYCTGPFTVEAGNPNYLGIDGVIFNKIQTELIQCPTSKTGTYTIPSSVTIIGSYAFAGCSGLASIIIPSTVNSIGYSAFYYCSGLFMVDAGNPNFSGKDGVLFNKTQNALIQCPNSKTGIYTIPSSVTSLRTSAFSGCSGLTSINIPSAVNSIGSFVFYNCSGLISIVVNSAFPVNLSSSKDVFYNVNKTTCKLLVPFGTSPLYSAVNQWKDFTTIEEMPEFKLSATAATIAATAGSTATINITAGLAWSALSNQTWLIVTPASGAGNQTLTFTPEANLSFNLRIATVTVTPTGVVAPQTILITQAGVLKTVSVTPGGLSSALTASELSTVSNLLLTGQIDARDFKTMRDNMPLLAMLDLSGATIASYTGTEGTAGTTNITYPVNAIPEFGFCQTTWAGKTTLQSITLPVSLTSIEKNAFFGCRGLSLFNIPSSVTSIGNSAFVLSGAYISVAPNNQFFSSINGVLFDKYQTSLIHFPTSKMGSYSISSSVTSIQWGAFRGCTGLSSVTIPSSVTDIQDWAFTNCSGLTSVTIPASVTYIGGYTFMDCKRLNSIELACQIPPDLTSSTDVFLNVNKSTCTLNVLFGTANLYRNANQWKDFTNILEKSGFKLSATTASLAATQTSTVSVDITSDVAWTASSDQTWLTVSPTSGTGNKTLIFTAEANPSFSMRTAILTVSAPGVASQTIVITQAGVLKTVTVNAGGLSPALTAAELSTISNLVLTGTIDARDFKILRDDMPLLAELDLNGVTVVAYTGTEGTAGTSSIDYLANAIPDYAFYNNITHTGKPSLKSVIFPSSVTSVGYGSFGACTGLNALIIPSSVTSIGTYAFMECRGLTSLTLMEGVSSVGGWAFGNCIGLSLINIPASLTSIGDAAFAGGGAITVDPNNMYYSSMDGVLFNKNATRLITCTIRKTGNYTVPVSVTTIGDGAFMGCRGLTSIILSSSVTDLGYMAFLHCSGLTSITIPSSVTHIGGSAFQGCYRLSSMAVAWSIPPDISSSPNVFLDVNSCTLYVPYGTSGHYRAANQWKDFTTIVEESMNLIRNGDFVTDGGLPVHWGWWSANGGSEPTVVNGTVLCVPGNATPEYWNYGFHQWNLTAQPNVEYIFSFTAWASANRMMNVAFNDNMENNYNRYGSSSDPEAINGRSEWLINLTTVPTTFTFHVVFDQMVPSTMQSVCFYLAASSEVVHLDNVSLISAEDLSGLMLSATTANIAATEGSTATVELTSDVAWTASSNQLWLTVSPTSGTGNHTLTFTAGANSSIEPRQATVSVLATDLPQNVTVVQAGSNAPLYVIAGGLFSALTAEELANVTKLTLTGTIDARDFKTMRDNMPLLAEVDLSGVTIAAYTGTEGTASTSSTIYAANAIPQFAFINTNTWLGKTSLISIVFPSSVTSIGDSAFRGCTGLGSITISSSVTSIENVAFYGCSGFLTVEASNPNYSSINGLLFNKAQTTLIYCPISKTGSYTIPATVTSIKNSAFVSSNLTSIIIPSSVNSIGNGAFVECLGLSSIIIPSSVTSIGNDAFGGCSGLFSIYAGASLPIDLNSSTKVFSGVDKTNCNLYVPAGTKAAYQAANQWKDFVNIVEMQNASAVVKKTTTAPIVDGTIDAVWSTANTYNIAVPHGTPTLGLPGTTTWKALWTNDGIYILLQVNDDFFFPAYAATPPGSDWMYDRAEIYFDVNQLLTDAQGPANGNGHYQFAPGFVENQINKGAFTNWDGSTYAFTVTDPAYVAEYFIPFNKLLDKDGIEVTKIATIGFDVIILDRDSEATNRMSAGWSDDGLNGGAWNNMDGCGTITLEVADAGILVAEITVNSAGNATTIETNRGTLQMTASILPVNATYPNVQWSVTNGTGKATISADGVLAALSNGTVTVIANSMDGSNISATMVITISNQVVTPLEASNMIFSLIGTAFYKSDGVTIPFWDYDIDLTYLGTSGNVSSYRINNQKLLQNGEFKIRRDHKWDVSYGYNQVTFLGDSNNFAVGSENFNIKVLAGKIYEIIFTADWVNNSYTLAFNEILNPTLHFTPVWTGNGLDHMNINIYSAKLDGVELEASDEIGIFDGTICVGVGTLTEPITSLNTLDIAVSRNDGSGNGYTSGNSISYKLYDKSKDLEMTNVSAVYSNTDPSWSTDGKFTISATAFAELTGLTKVNQDITLNTGWNIISANVVPANLNLKDIFQTLIDAGKLKKVMDEAGKTIENFGAFGGWKNNIGNLNSAKGYKVNVLSTSTLSLEGTPVPLPFDLALATGWNIISYPSATAQDAKALVQSLIDAGKLKKVMDEAGKTIENFGAFGGWKNNIGNFLPGKGYKVNVLENCTLILPATANKAATIVPEVLASTHFTKAFTGNGTDHMNIHLVNLQASGLQAGDEIGIFDGKLCVGSAMIGAEQLMAGSISIPASTNDEIGETPNGFMAGNRVSVKLYRDGQAYPMSLTRLEGQDIFDKNASLFAQVSMTGTTEINDFGNEINFRYYPNPFTEQITIEIQSASTEKLEVNIYDLNGKLLRKLYSGKAQNQGTLVWDGRNDAGARVVQGTYLINANGRIEKVVLKD